MPLQATNCQIGRAAFAGPRLTPGVSPVRGALTPCASSTQQGGGAVHGVCHEVVTWRGRAVPKNGRVAPKGDVCPVHHSGQGTGFGPAVLDCRRIGRRHLVAGLVGALAPTRERWNSAQAFRQKSILVIVSATCAHSAHLSGHTNASAGQFHKLEQASRLRHQGPCEHLWRNE
jgi:hypothetical protein